MVLMSEPEMSYCDRCGRDVPGDQVDQVSYQPFWVCHGCIDAREQTDPPDP